jgi:hypothetical protein
VRKHARNPRSASGLVFPHGQEGEEVGQGRHQG